MIPGRAPLDHFVGCTSLIAAGLYPVAKTFVGGPVAPVINAESFSEIFDRFGNVASISVVELSNCRYPSVFCVHNSEQRVGSRLQAARIRPPDIYDAGSYSYSLHSNTPVT